MEASKDQQAKVYNQPPKPKVPMYMVAIVITLSVLAIVLGIVLYQNNQTLLQSEEDKVYIEQQKVEMEGELNELIVGYDSLRTENDSINDRLAIEQEKIRSLLRVNASNTQKLKMYEKELGTLRKIMRSYIVQIDSLNTRNRELTEENIAVRTELRRKEADIEKLSEETNQLSTTVAAAQKLTAKNILAEGLNSRSKPKEKIDKIEKVRVCFTIRENSIAEAGSKMIYMQLKRPDEVILSSPDAGMFTVGEENMVYSAKRELEYDNLDIDLCIYWDKTEEMIPGTYFISLYSEGHEIGTSTMELK